MTRTNPATPSNQGESSSGNQTGTSSNRKASLRNASKRFYKEHKQDINRKRILKKMKQGQTILESTLKKYGLEDFEYTETKERKAVADGRKLYEEMKAKYGEKKQLPYLTMDNINFPEEFEQIPVAGASNENGNDTPVSLNEFIARFENRDGLESFEPSTLKIYASKMRKAMKFADADPDNIVPVIKDVDNTIKKINERSIAKRKELYDKRVAKVEDAFDKEQAQRQKNNEPPLPDSELETRIANVKHNNAGKPDPNDFTPIIFFCNRRNLFPKFCNAVGSKAINAWIQYEKQFMSKTRLGQIKKTQTAKVVKWTTIQKALSDIRQSKRNSQEHLLVALYNAYPLRNNFWNVRLWKKSGKPPNDKQNYYDVLKDILYLRKYKTMKKYGDQEMKMPQQPGLKRPWWTKDNDITKIVDAIISKDGKREYLFINPKTNEPYTENAMGIYVKQVFTSLGVKNVGIDEIRHSAVNFVWTPDNKIDTDDNKAQLAEDMKHDVDTARNVYFNKETIEEA